MGLCSIWYIKRQFCRFRISGNFSIFHSLYTQLIGSWCFLKVIFLRAWFWSFWNVVIVSLIFWPHSREPYCKWDSNSEWYAVFSILKFALIRKLLSMLVAPLSLIFICVICLFQRRCSSIKTPRYLTEWVRASLLPSNLNLKLWSCFKFSWSKDNNSVFFTLRLSLLALNQFKTFYKYIIEDILLSILSKSRTINWLSLFCHSGRVFLVVYCDRLYQCFFEMS